MPEIHEALSEAGISDPNEFQIQHSLFYCRDEASRGVGFAMTCNNQCYETSQSDFCDSIGPVSTFFSGSLWISRNADLSG